MCGRYNFKADLNELISHFSDLQGREIVSGPRFNVAPTQSAPVLVMKEHRPRIEMLRWGLIPFWAKDESMAARMINARAETVVEKPAFRSAFKKQRCLVIAHGFYEWTATLGGKQPWHIGRSDGGLTPFAGLWETWKRPQMEQELHSFTIITTTPNEVAGKIHDRMPVILPEERWDAWLAPETSVEDLQTMLVPCDSSRMKAYRVSPKMNNARYEASDCVEPLPDELKGL